MNTTHDTGSEKPTPRGDDGLARVTFLPGVVPFDASTALAGTRIEEHPTAPAQTALRQTALRQSAPRQGTPRQADEAGVSKAEEKAQKRAANVSMHALTRRDMSRWELVQTLVSRGLEPEQVDEEITRLEGVGLIDDAALAETIVRTQHERKGLGRSALMAELRRRHVEQEHIDAALESLDADDELERARELAHRRAPQMRSLDRATAVRRLSGFLMRKGYSSSIVRTAVDEALAEMGTTVRFR